MRIKIDIYILQRPSSQAAPFLAPVPVTDGGHVARTNLLCIHLVFEDDDFELAVARFIHHLLGRRYRPFREAIFTWHCG